MKKKLFLFSLALIIAAPGCAHKPPAPQVPASFAMTDTQAQALSALRTAQASTFTNAPAAITNTPPVAAPVAPVAVPPAVASPVPVAAPVPVIEAPAPRQSESLPVSKSSWHWYFLLGLVPVGGAAYYFWPKIKAWLEKQKVLTEIEAFAKAAEKDVATYWHDIEAEAEKLVGKTPAPAPVAPAPKVLPKAPPAPVVKAPEPVPATAGPEVAPHADAAWTTPQRPGPVK